MIPTLYEPFRHWSDGVLSDIPSIHRITIDGATMRKKGKKVENKNEKLVDKL